MNILVLGSGGREHTLAWKISHSPLAGNLFVSPGNAGTASIATNINIGVNEFEKIAGFINENDISMVIVGPEDPLVNGITDFLRSHNEVSDDLMVIGPGASGARLEGSKDFSKKFLEKFNIPTAKSRTFTSDTISEGIAYLKTKNLPIVLKADGLAAGKGVIIAPNHDIAEKSLREMLLDKKFGEASSRVLIEDFLEGIEVSVFVLTDGENYLVLPEAKDYKRIGEGDTGPNTGGMGAVSPVPFYDAEFRSKVEERIIKPTILGLKDEDIPYKGFVFIGLMNVDGDPYVIEYNVRMGDPESQAVLPRIENDFVELLTATARGTLDNIILHTSKDAAVTIVLASEGYPGNYEKGRIIKGLDTQSESLVYHAGTTESDHSIKTNGGRVLAVTGMSNDVSGAIANAYNSIKKIKWEGMQFRKDIGQDILSLL